MSKPEASLQTFADCSLRPSPNAVGPSRTCMRRHMPTRTMRQQERRGRAPRLEPAAPCRCSSACPLRLQVRPQAAKGNGRSCMRGAGRSLVGSDALIYVCLLLLLACTALHLNKAHIHPLACRPAPACLLGARRPLLRALSPRRQPAAAGLFGFTSGGLLCAAGGCGGARLSRRQLAQPGRQRQPGWQWQQQQRLHQRTRVAFAAGCCPGAVSSTGAAQPGGDLRSSTPHARCDYGREHCKLHVCGRLGIMNEQLEPILMPMQSQLFSNSDWLLLSVNSFEPLPPLQNQV